MSNLTENTFSNTVSYNVKLLIVQVLVGILLYVNGLMIFTFLKKEVFWVETRYILFAQTLFVDSTNMLLTDLTMVGSFHQYPVHILPCCIFCTLMSLLSICTPVTLAAMCLERYVAICMPLRHSSISTPKNTFIGLLVIWTVSFVIPLFVLTVFLVYASPFGLGVYVVCSLEVMLRVKWLADTRAASLQILFIILFGLVVSTYIKIMLAARSASSDKKSSTKKSLKTVILHGIQLFLCMLQLLMPYIEMPLWNVDVVVFLNVKYSNFVLFMISPRCLSPLIYGLRDKKFCQALKHYAFCGISLGDKNNKIGHIKTIPLEM
ncbi:odorant receptor 131-2-like [Triplophysa dalaica]|uniref:odorant receptor 131-2-like n=1 Tax=Triplophysa dalaica TaxID=1582913 RepID=UPI0024DFBFE6|nr:odorant receptor 131-2-like [Triplophysa dalaica]